MARRQLITLREAARRLGLSYYQVYRLLLAGTLKGRQVAGVHWYVYAADVGRLRKRDDGHRAA